MRRANGNSRARKVMILPEVGPVDGRTRPAIKFRETAAALADDLGGVEALTRAQMELIRRASGFAVLGDQVEERLVRGEEIAIDQYVNIAATQSRILRSLGLKRVPKDVTIRLEDVEAGLIDG
jgi:hypothetical protein